MNRSAERSLLDGAEFADPRPADRPPFSDGQLLSRLGHELRSPLTGIIGLTRILVRNASAGPLDPETQVRQLNLVLTSAAQMLHVTEQVVDIARLQSGLAASAPVVFDCVETIAETVRAHQPTATARGIHLLAEVPTGPHLLTGDARLLGRLLYELVDNAVRYADGGDVRIRVGDPRPDAITIDVADDGPIIAADERARIFDPFERGEAGAAHDDGGAGLGLYLARQLADQLGAKLSLRVDAGPGTTFTVEIPLRPPPVTTSTGRGRG